jgi:hypothetical protein
MRVSTSTSSSMVVKITELPTQQLSALLLKTI